MSVPLTKHLASRIARSLKHRLVSDGRPVGLSHVQHAFARTLGYETWGAFANTTGDTPAVTISTDCLIGFDDPSEALPPEIAVLARGVPAGTVSLVELLYAYDEACIAADSDTAAVAAEGADYQAFFYDAIERAIAPEFHILTDPETLDIGDVLYDLGARELVRVTAKDVGADFLSESVNGSNELHSLVPRIYVRLGQRLSFKDFLATETLFSRRFTVAETPFRDAAEFQFKAAYAVDPGRLTALFDAPSTNTPIPSWHITVEDIGQAVIGLWRNRFGGNTAVIYVKDPKSAWAYVIDHEVWTILGCGYSGDLDATPPALTDASWS